MTQHLNRGCSFLVPAKDIANRISNFGIENNTKECMDPVFFGLSILLMISSRM